MDDLFRKNPFESLSSLHHTDRLLRVVRIRGWISLCFFLCLVVILGGWAFRAEIPIHVDGKGVLFAPYNTVKIQTLSEGVVEEVKIKEKETVNQGERVATLKNTSKQFEYEEKKERLRSLQKEIAGYKKLFSEEKQIELGSGEKVLANQREKVNALIGWIQREGDIPSSYSLQIELFNALSSIATQEMEIALIKKELLSLSYADKLNSLSQELSITQAELRQLDLELEGLEVFAPVGGTIMEVTAIPGEFLPSNSMIGWMQTPLLPGCCQLIYAFLPMAAGEKVKEGMLAKIELASVDPKKYGMLLGKVKEILPYPASEEGGRLKILPSVELRKYLVSGPLSLLVLIELLPDPSTPTGYQWTSLQGPPSMIMPGTIAEVQVILEKKRPISYIFPMLGSSS